MVMESGGPGLFTVPVFRQVADEMARIFAEDGRVNGNTLAAVLGGEGAETVARILAVGPKGDDFRARLLATMEYFNRKAVLEPAEAEYQEEIRTAERGSDEALESLLKLAELKKKEHRVHEEGQ
jgi:hypothetical protein